MTPPLVTGTIGRDRRFFALLLVLLLLSSPLLRVYSTIPRPTAPAAPAVPR